MSEDFVFKLKVLELLSERGELPLVEIEKQLGLSPEMAAHIVEDLQRNFLMKLIKARLTWSEGDNPRVLSPWGWNYIYRSVVGSTMLVASHAPQWSIILAETQLHGKGRMDKTWISNLGGVWITFKFPLSHPNSGMLPLAIPVVLIRFLQERLGLNALIKWPNDIIINDKKVAGILIKAEAQGHLLTAYVGIGINVNNDPPVPEATSISREFGKLIPRNKLIAYLSGVMARLDKVLERAEYLQLEYLNHLGTLGKKVRILAPEGELIGIAKGITKSGELLVETERGILPISSESVIQLRHIG